MKLSGLSRPTVEHNCELGVLFAVKTKKGHWRVKRDQSRPAAQIACPLAGDELEKLVIKIREQIIRERLL